eukprot:1340430-Rhodomonas_salina.1
MGADNGTLISSSRCVYIFQAVKCSCGRSDLSPTLTRLEASDWVTSEIKSRVRSDLEHMCTRVPGTTAL